MNNNVTLSSTADRTHLIEHLQLDVTQNRATEPLFEIEFKNTGESLAIETNSFMCETNFF